VHEPNAALAKVIRLPVCAPPVRSAAFFDVDRTLLPGSSLFPLAQAMYRKGFIDPRRLTHMAADHVRYRLSGERRDGVHAAKMTALAAVRGCERRWLMDIAEQVVHERLVPRVYPRARDLIAKHQDAGRLVILASSSPMDYLAILAHALGLDGVVATRLEVHDGHYTGQLEGELCHGREKALRVRLFARASDIDLDASYAYSDSAADIPLLEMTGNPAAVNPDAALLQRATSRGWRVLRFKAGPLYSRPWRTQRPGTRRRDGTV
jgi:HAD superfamily hydrolase (TIGR01490 family)